MRMWFEPPSEGNCGPHGWVHMFSLELLALGKWFDSFITLLFFSLIVLFGICYSRFTIHLRVVRTSSPRITNAGLINSSKAASGEVRF